MRALGWVLGVLVFTILMGFISVGMYTVGQLNATKTIIRYCETDNVYLEQGLMMQCKVIKSDSKN